MDLPRDETDRAAPLLLSTDGLLIGDLRRLAAAAGVSLAVVGDPPAALQAWSAASVVLVGADQAAALASTRPSRRPRVHVLARGALPDDAFRQAVEVGAESVAELPASEAWLVELLTDIGDGAAAPGLTIGVVGGAGGVGATVFAAALARCAAATGPSLLVDIDLFGAGLDRVLGLESRSGVRWDAMMAATGRLGARSLREALPEDRGLSLLTFPARRPSSLPGFAVREVLSAARRGFETVVLDLPRSADPVVAETMTRCDRLVVLSTLTVPAVTAASRVTTTLPPAVPALLVTRGAASSLAPEEVARVLGLPLVAAMPDQRGLDEAINLGAGPVRSRRSALARGARHVLATLREDRAVA